MSIEMRPPKYPSSHISSMGYDAETGTLAVEFHKGGGVYHYHGVDVDTHDGLYADPSPGTFLWQNIRGRFNHTKR